MSALGLVGAPHAALELDDGPGVAAGQGGPGDLREVPGDTASLLGHQADGALQQAVAERVFLKHLQTCFIRKEAFSLLRDNILNGWIRAKIKESYYLFLCLNIIGISLMKVGVTRRLCSCPGASLMVVLLILVGVASGDPSSTVKALKFTQICHPHHQM